MPANNPYDRKLTAVLKSMSKGIKDATTREKVSKDFHAIRSRVVDATLRQILDDLFQFFSAPTDQRAKSDQAQAVAVIRVLCDRQFVSSAAFLFAGWRDLVASLPLDTVLPLAPDAASFEIWRKASTHPAKEIEQRLLASPVPTYATAATDWLLLRVPPEKQLPLIDLFLTRQPRPKYLPAWAEALALTLQKDRRFVLLPILLNQPWSDENRVLALAEVIRSTPVLMKTVIDALPHILTSKEPPAGAMPLVRNLFANLTTTSDTERQFASALLARLGTGILLHRDLGHSATQALDYVQQAARQLRGTTRDGETQSQTWVLQNLKAEEMPVGGHLQITLDGALRFAVAFEKAAQDFPVADILTMTAHNLGLTPIEEKGKMVSYDPVQHEDIDGGMIPGDLAYIETQGWSHGENVILRAKAREKKD